MILYISIMDDARTCLFCNKVLRGRIDKKFCDDYCRNAHNNRQNSDQNNFVRNVNNILRKNRRILESLVPAEGLTRQPRRKLSDQGFNFLYHTHRYTNKKGDVYFFCYEYGFLPLENEWVLIVKREEK